MIDLEQFQSDILSTLAEAVPGSGAYFYDTTGGLCIPADQNVAYQVLALLSLLTCGQVQISGPLDGEYLIDFL